MAEKKIRMLIFDNNEGFIQITKIFIENKFPSIEVTTSTSIEKAENYLKTKGPFNIFSCDLRAAPPGVPNERVIPRIIGLLKSAEKTYPQMHLAIISGIIPPEKLKGVRFIYKFGKSYTKPLAKFLNEIMKNPWKRPGGEKIDSGQLKRPMRHVESPIAKAGLMSQARAEAIRNLEISLAQVGAKGREKRLWTNALAVLKRPHIMK